MKNKTLLFRLFALVAALACALGASAYNFQSGNIYYKILTGNTVAVTYRDGNYNSYSGEVNIPETVTYGSTTYNVTAIDQVAFYKCSNLKHVSLPKTIQQIGDLAFRNCPSLESVYCHAMTPPVMGDGVFDESVVDNLSVGVPMSELPAYENAEGWYELPLFELNYDFEQDGIFYLFGSDGTASVTQKEDHFNYLAYQGYVDIPWTVTYQGTTYMVTGISPNAFAGCDYLEGVCIGYNVKDVGTGAFDGCTDLKRVTIPESVTIIRNRAFRGCTSLETITCNAWTPPTIYAATFESSTYTNATLRVPYQRKSQYQAANYWQNFLNIEGSYDLYEALNPDGEFELESEGVFAWTTEEEGGRIYAMSSNAGVPNSTSSLTAWIYMEEANYALSFDFKAWGEGSGVNDHDACVFEIDGVEQFRYGDRDNEWETYKVDLTQGLHTLKWRYIKGDNVNPEGDYFAIDNMQIIPPEAYACYTESNTTLTFYYDTQRSSRPGTTYDLNTGANEPAWETDSTNSSVTKVVFDPSFADARPTTTYDWFYDMTNLQSITGMSYLNTSEVTNMAWMFTNCKKLTSLDVSHFNTAKVTNMVRMFNSCSGLTSLDLSSFNTANVTGMNYMFNGCSGLTSLDLSSFNTSKVTDMAYMFYGNSNLRTIYVGNGWSTAAVTYSSAMFEDCTKLVGGQGTTYSASNPMDKTYAHIDGGPSNPGYFTAEGDEPWAILEAYACYTPSNTTLTFYYDKQRNSRQGTTYDLNTGTHDTGWHTDSTNAEVTKVVFDPSFVDASPTTTYYWFYFMTNLQSITGMEYLNTSEVTKMGYMFTGCNQLTSIDVTHFNTSKVTDMGAMFAYCDNLTSLDLSSFNTSQVTEMSFMFYVCSNLRTIYVGNGWSTSAVTTSYNMFYNCTSLVGGQGTTYNSWYPMDKTYAHIDCGPSYPGFFTKDPNAPEAYACYTESNTTLTFYCDKLRSSRPGTTYDLNTGGNVTDWENDGTNANVTKVVFDSSFADARPMTTYAWFYYMENLQSITGMNYLNTGDVTNMGSMFCKCTKLTSLDLSSFNTSQVTSMWGIFFGCSSLTSLDLSSFNTSQVTRMISMFYDCSSLTSLDLSSFNTSQVTDMGSMFRGCSSLRTVYVGDDWSTAAVTYSKDMFDGCTSLVGGLGTTYNASNPTDKTYAHIDGGPSNPGYFSAEPEAYACYTPSNTTLTFYYDSQRSVRPGTTYDLNTGSQDTGWDTDGTNVNVTKVVFDPSFAGARPTTTCDWFYNMGNLQSVTGMSYLNTSEVTHMGWMFSGCTELTNLDLSNFNTANVTNMWGMFILCSSLTSLDLSSFNTSQVTDMISMFNRCINLRTIYVGNGWSTASVTSSTWMFYDCTNLVGGQGTTWNANYIDKTYAHLDGGPSNPGYFTAKTAFQLGDVNRDGQVNIGDVTTLIGMVLRGTATAASNPEADLTGDGSLNIADVTTLISLVLRGA